MLKRILVLLGLPLFFTAALLLAMAAGRRIDPRIIISPHGVADGGIIYSLTDMSRRVTAEHTLYAPDMIDAAWLTAPPLILQRVRDERASEYVLSELDPARGELTPVVRLTTHRDMPLIALGFVLRRSPEGTRAAVYLVTGEIRVTDVGSPQARLLATVENNLQFPLQWSPDGATISVKDTDRAGLALVTVADGTVRRVDAPSDAWVVWSPDSRFILLNTLEVVGENTPVRVIDVAAGTVAPPTAGLTGRVARWCGAGTFLYVNQVPVGLSEVRLMDILRGEAETVMPTGKLLGQVVISTAPVSGHGCDWLLVGARHFSEAGTRMYLLDRSSGDIQLLGNDIRVLGVTGDMLEYEVVVGGIPTRKWVELRAGL